MKRRILILAALLLAIGVQFLAIERPALAAPSGRDTSSPVEPPSYAGAATPTEVPTQQTDPATSEPPEAQARRNRELAVRPFLFAAFLTAGAVIGMLLVSRRRKRKGHHG